MPIIFVNGPNDDLLYIRLAQSMLDGSWLGDFNQLTLSHGPFFSMFLAAAAMLRLPLNLACQAVYLGGSLLLGRTVGRALRCRPAATCCFALLALNPMPYTWDLSRVVREKLYVGLTILVVALLARCLPMPAIEPEADRARPRGAWACLSAGVGFGAFWLTREEGVWLLPAVALVFGVRIASAALHGKSQLWLKLRAGARQVAFAGLAVAGCFAVLLPVAAVNDHYYGVFRTNDFQTGPFAAGLNAFERVVPKQWQRYVPAPRDVRAEIYAVSAAARELQPGLEGRSGQSWTSVGCAANPIPNCDDLQSGWFMYALRQAATEAGHYRSAPETDRFFRRLTAEVDVACTEHLLACLPASSSLSPPFRQEYLSLTLHSFWNAFLATAALGNWWTGVLPTDFFLPTPPTAIAEARRVVLGPYAPSSTLAESHAQEIEGSVNDGDGTARLSIENGRQIEVETGLEELQDPDAGANAGSRARNVHFTWAGRCALDDCRLVVTHDGTVVIDEPVAQLRAGTSIAAGSTILTIANQKSGPSYAEWAIEKNIPRQAAYAAAAVIRPLSRFGLPIAILLVLVSFVTDLAHRRLRPIVSIALLLLVALFARLAVVAIYDATTYPAGEPRFIAPGAPLALALIAVAFSATVLSARDLYRRSGR